MTWQTSASNASSSTVSRSRVVGVWAFAYVGYNDRTKPHRLARRDRSVRKFLRILDFLFGNSISELGCRSGKSHSALEQSAVRATELSFTYRSVLSISRLQRIGLPCTELHLSHESA